MTGQTLERTEAPSLEEHEDYFSMNAEERAVYAIRQMYLEVEPQIADIPEDIEYKVDYTSGVTGQKRNSFSGTFGGSSVEVAQSSWDGGKTWKTYGTRGGEDLTQEEAEELFGSIYPVVEVFDDMRKSQQRAASEMHTADREMQEAHRREVEEAAVSAREAALVEGEKLGEVKAILGIRLKEIDVDEADREFADELINDIAQLAANPDFNQPYDGPYRHGSTLNVMRRVEPKIFDDKETVSKKRAIEEDYKRRSKLLHELLGVDQDDPQEWGAGFGVTHKHSKVFDTVFPDMIARECYDRRELGLPDNINGARLTIERNSQYQRQSD